MCDVFLCSDEGVGLCDDDKMLLENLGRNEGNNNNDENMVDQNDGQEKEKEGKKDKEPGKRKQKKGKIHYMSPILSQ